MTRPEDSSAEGTPGGDVEAELMRAEVRARLFASAPKEPTRIGRFVVLRRLGAGAMGVVYAAYDEELDRKVAVKLLRGGRAGRGSEGRMRLLREAQALAKLAHPN